MTILNKFRSSAGKWGLYMMPFLLAFVARAQSGQTPGGSGKLTNPLKSETIAGFLTNVLDVLLVFATPIIILFIMYAGFLFVTARGNEGQIEKARAALLWAVVGGVILLGAKIIAGIINTTITGL